MSVFFDMFVPSRRHVEEERNRQEWTRDEEGEGDPHRGPIDLDSGVVSIKPPESGPVTKAAAATEPAATEPSAGKPPVAKPTVTKPAVSQIRHSEP